jgi:hypothetical protein
MTIAQFEPHHAFDPEADDVLASAFEKLCAQLGLSAHADRMTELVARHVIEAAKTGMRNETAILLSAMQGFTANPQ